MTKGARYPPSAELPRYLGTQLAVSFVFMDLFAALSYSVYLLHNLTGLVRMHGVGGMGKDALLCFFFF